jgi:hypothetical protein
MVLQILAVAAVAIVFVVRLVMALHDHPTGNTPGGATPTGPAGPQRGARSK